MSLHAVIRDSKSGNSALVTEFGQLVVAALDYSMPVERDLDTAGVAVNFIEPRAGHSIVITDVIASANKDVSVTETADIAIFQADAVDQTTPNPGILSPQLLRGGNLPLTGLNFKVPEGKWVNATTTDAIIKLTIAFYRVPLENNS